MRPHGDLLWKSLVIVYICCLVSVKGSIRCYCNREECKDTHTCISRAEKCYSKLYTVYNSDNKTAESLTQSADEHGCVDSVDTDNRDHHSICDGSGDFVKQLKQLEPLIMCCSDSLCNYRKNQDIHVDIIDSAAAKQKDKTSEKGFVKSDEVEDTSEAPDNGEAVIFRAAVIAVPIAGGLILVILILMAVRMLRDDSRRSDSQDRLFKTHTFIEQHFVRKEEKKKNSLINSHIKKEPASVHRTTAIQTSQQPQSTDRLIQSANNTTSVRPKSQVLVSLLNSHRQSDPSPV